MWQLINMHVRHKSHNNSTTAFSDLKKLNDYFANLGTNTTKHLKFNMNYKQYLTNPIENSMFISPVTEAEIFNIVSGLPSNQYHGDDEINIIHIKSIINVIVESLCIIFNKSFLTGQFLSFLKIARITPIYKFGIKII